MSKAPIMIPDDPDHRESLIADNGYREGFLVDAMQEQPSRVTLTVQDRETGKNVTVDGVSMSSLYGANKRMLSQELVDELDEKVYTPGAESALDGALVAETMLADPDRVSGLRFVYHGRFFD